MRNSFVKSAALVCLLSLSGPVALRAEQVVTLSGLSFTPSDLTIGAGETVRWVWSSGFHSTTSRARSGPEVWDSGVESTASFSFSHTFTTVGDHDYSYDCSLASPVLHFTDISTSQSFCRHVHYLWAKDVVNGCTGTTYCPEPFVTRLQMAKFLVLGFARKAPEDSWFAIRTDLVDYI